MGDGEAREFGTGAELMGIENGVFKGMVEESGRAGGAGQEYAEGG